MKSSAVLRCSATFLLGILALVFAGCPKPTPTHCRGQRAGAPFDDPRIRCGLTIPLCTCQRKIWSTPATGVWCI